MAFPSTPRDAQNIPIGCVYVPGVGFVATQGGASINTDVNGNMSAPITVSGTITATSAANGTNGAAAPSTSTQIGASDGTNLQPLQVESSSNKNLRTAVYNGSNELAIDGSGNASVKLAAGSALIGNVELVDSGGTNKASISAGGALKVDNSGVVQTVAGSVTANIGTSGSLALESGGNLATLAGAVSSSKVQTNTAQINGVAPSMGNGASGTGVQRVTIASDSTGQVALAAGSAVIGHVIADSGSTTAVTQATASNLNAQVVGSVASAGSNAGNPVKVGGAFNTTQPTVTNGQIVDAQMTSRGAQIVATGTDAFNATVNAIASALSQTNQVPVCNSATQGKLTLSGSLTANSDNSITFSGGATVARRIRIQNESSGTIYWETDATASAGSPSLAAPAANAVSVEWIAVQCTTLHIFIPSGGTTTLNGSGGVKITAYA